MQLSNHNALALLIDVNQQIEAYAAGTVRNIIDERNFDSLAYPPNGGFTEQEKQELNKLSNNEQLKNALRKLLADTSAGVIFHMFNLLDGTGSPDYMYDEWTGVQLVDEDDDEETGRPAGVGPCPCAGCRHGTCRCPGPDLPVP